MARVSGGGRLPLQHLDAHVGAGVRGGVGTPAKAVLRKLMRWYVEPLAYDQRSFNAAALRLIDDLEARVAQLEAQLKQRS